MLRPGIQQLEYKLAQMHRVEYACLSGNATVSLVIALEVLNLHKKRIAIPANACFSVAQAVLYSDNIPVFVDIDKKTHGIDKKCIKNVDAVIAIHAFGRGCDIKAIQQICRERKIPLIEDCAVAQGATVDMEPVGSFGDIAVLSFGAGKIIDMGHGGALLFNGTSLNQSIRKKIATLSNKTKKDERNINALGCLFTSLYNQCYIDLTGEVGSRFYDALMLNKGAYFHQFDERVAGELIIKLKDLKDNIHRRNGKAARLQKYLSGVDEIKPFKHTEQDVYWRQNVSVKTRRNELLKFLLTKGYPVSSWYPTLESYLFTGKQKTDYSNSDALTETIINLWVNDEVDAQYAANITDDMKRFSDSYV